MTDKQNKEKLDFNFKNSAGWKLMNHMENLQKLANKKPRKEVADSGRK